MGNVILPSVREISLILSVLNGVAGGQLIDNETFTKGTFPE